MKQKLPVEFIFLLLVGAFFLGVFVNQKFAAKSQVIPKEENKTANNLEILQEKVLPKNGYRFKINWGILGKKMIDDGVIDKVKLAKALTGKEILGANFDKYLNGSNQKEIELNQENAQFWVDVLWGLGLANKNPILESGPMAEGGNTANFASTGGWTIGAKSPMDLYSKFSYITLSESQQKIVAEIAGNIYRPCCGNSTAFPDCNHGMAALGLIELMVAQNKSKEEIYKTVLAFNSYWFPQTYLDIAYHFQKSGRDYNKIPPQELLSKTFSSAMGYAVVRKEVGNLPWPLLQGGGSCGA
ncbi:MAG: hypothetical protein AAB662_04280 [Patescibacteria group bacterium]|mgnify:CR=1 FL=1